MKSSGSLSISLLTAGTIVTAATCDDNPFYGRITHQARFALPPVHPVLQLKESLAPFGVNVIAHRRAAQFDGVTQHFLHGAMEFAQLPTCQRRCLPARPNSRAEERLVSINVPHAA